MRNEDTCICGVVFDRFDNGFCGTCIYDCVMIE